MYLYEAQEINSINPPLESNHALPREVGSIDISNILTKYYLLYPLRMHLKQITN